MVPLCIIGVIYRVKGKVIVGPGRGVDSIFENPESFMFDRQICLNNLLE